MGMIELVPVSGINQITQLYQWDLDRQVMIWTREEGIEVHFAQTGDTEALVVQTDAKDGYFVANIPNIQLQNTRNLTVYIVKDDVTVASCTYSIAKREKPTDYVYTETDVKRFEDLEKRIEVIEKNKNENNEHPNNKEIHVTPEEKQAWNNKSNFSGSYNDLTDKPEIPKAPVQSVNGKSGDVLLNAEDVGARPNTWTPSAGDVGAEPSGTAQNKVSDHNTSEASHNDIRLLILELANRLNVLADSDDTTLDQMSEVVAYIKSNKTLIDAITTNKINVSDIVNDYATNVSNKPVSAAVAVRLKALIDAISIPTKTSQLKNDSGFLTQHQDISGLAPKATTLSGYGITDGATKEQASQLSQEFSNYLPKNQGASNVGKILVVGTDGNLILTDMPEGGAIGDVTGVLDESNNILLSGNLADGTYTLKYLNGDGTYTEIGSLVVGAIPEPEPVKTNFFVIDGDGYLNPGRLSSMGADRTDVIMPAVTNYIAVQNGDTVEVSGCAIRCCLNENDYNNSTYAHMSGYNSNKVNVYTDNSYETNAYWSVDSISDSYAQLTVLSADIAYFRFICASSIKSWNARVNVDNIVINIKRNGEWL